MIPKFVTTYFIVAPTRSLTKVAHIEALLSNIRITAISRSRKLINAKPAAPDLDYVPASLRPYRGYLRTAA